MTLLTALLATKVTLPEHAQAVVARPRLTEALEQGVIGHRLTVVSAPAGYGKTTLLADWAHHSGSPVAWLALDADDNDPERFLRGVLGAWVRVWPALSSSPLALLLGGQSPDPQAARAAFLNAAAELETNLVVVLDEYHLLDDRAIHQHLTYWLDHLPARLHFVLGTRAEPPLPLARYRARGQLLELGAQDLRFTRDEAAAFLSTTMQVPASTETIERLQAGLEGWVAGLQLAALSLRHGRAPDALVTGQQRFIADFLSQEVLSGLPAEVRAFLVQTSLLDRLCGPLCEAVTEQPDGQARLEGLERQNLFVRAVDDERRWFRYHPILADYLRAELARQPQEQVETLHRRAAAWYAAHEMPEAGYEHALAGRDRERLIEIAEKHLMVKLWVGEYRLVRHWTEAVPAEWAATYPLFGLIRAGVLAFASDYEAANRSVDELEATFVASVERAEPWQMARIKAVRCGLACLQDDLALAEHYAGQG
jgi:LuxR family transcriptional regulator, maltose regulon positive regulatory protein